LYEDLKEIVVSSTEALLNSTQDISSETDYSHVSTDQKSEGGVCIKHIEHLIPKLKYGASIFGDRLSKVLY
jgi:recombinational DNA repair protein (RecF pathway)